VSGRQANQPSGQNEAEPDVSFTAFRNVHIFYP